MSVARQTERITEIFGRRPELLQWVLRDPVTRTGGLIVNLTDFQRELLYRFCVLGLDEGEVIDWLAASYPEQDFAEAIERVKVDIMASAPALLDVYRERRASSRRRKA